MCLPAHWHTLLGKRLKGGDETHPNRGGSNARPSCNACQSSSSTAQFRGWLRALIHGQHQLFFFCFAYALVLASSACQPKGTIENPQACLLVLRSAGPSCSSMSTRRRAKLVDLLGACARTVVRHVPAHWQASVLLLLLQRSVGGAQARCGTATRQADGPDHTCDRRLRPLSGDCRAGRGANVDSPRCRILRLLFSSFLFPGP